MSSLNSVIKTLIKVNLTAALLSVVSMIIIRQYQSQQVYNSESPAPSLQVYHSEVEEKPPQQSSSDSEINLKLAKKVEKLEGELAQTKEKITDLSKAKPRGGSEVAQTRTIVLNPRLATRLSLSPEYKIIDSGAEQEREKVEISAVAPRVSQATQRGAVTNESRVESNTPAPIPKPKKSTPLVSTRVLKTQEINQANHLEQQKLGSSKPQTLQAKANPTLNHDNIQNQELTPLPVKPLAGNDNTIVLSLRNGSPSLNPSRLENRQDIAVREERIIEEATLLYGNSDITLSGSDIGRSPLLALSEQTASIRLANDIAYGLIIAGEKGQINYGTKAYRRVQTAIRVLRRGEELYDAARIAEVPSELLQQLIRWGENRPGSLAAMIETNPDNEQLR